MAATELNQSLYKLCSNRLFCEENVTLSMDTKATPHKPLERSLVFLVVCTFMASETSRMSSSLPPKGKAESSFATAVEQWQRQQSDRKWRQKLFYYWKSPSWYRNTKKTIKQYFFYFSMCVLWQANQSLMCQFSSWLPSIIKELSETNIVTPVTNAEFMRSFDFRWSSPPLRLIYLYWGLAITLNSLVHRLGSRF